MSDSELLRGHLPCPHCNSSDAAAEYDDGHWYCFSCGKIWGGNSYERKDVEQMVAMEDKGRVREITERCISEETCKKFGVRTLKTNGKIVKHYYPYYNKKGEQKAEKVRTVEGKNFIWTGEKSDLQLFGAQCQPTTGRFVVVCEGEIDTLSMYQVLGGRYTVVSLPDGCRSFKALKDNYQYLDKFDNIILCLDGDKPGREAVERAIQYLPHKKVKLMKFSEDLKDPNEMLMQGKTQELLNLFWRAEEYRPEDIINIGDMFERLSEYRKTHNYTPTPWTGLTDMIQGTRPGQLIVIAAGTGSGKSLFLRNWMYYLMQTTQFSVGALYLEENPEETVISLMSIAAGKNLKKNAVWDSCTDDELKEYFNSCNVNRRIELFDPLSNTDPDYICSKIRYLAVARGCQYIILDHITYLADDAEDPRRCLNKLIKNLHDLCVELGIVIIAACHLRKSPNANKTHEEGGRVTLDDLKDSSSIKQLSDVIIGLERNGQDEDQEKANTTLLRVLKNRDFGLKGPATALYYDKNTTRLTEVGFEETSEQPFEGL